MANSTPAYLIGVLVIISNACCALALSCYNLYSHLNYEYCYGSENHCCGSYGYQYCCYYSLEGGAIAGIVIGCLIGIALLVTLVIICCVAMNKNRGTIGRVVHPAGGAGLTVVNTSSQQQAMYGGTPQYTPQYGPSYPQYGGGYSNPASAPVYGSNPGPAYPPTQPVNPPPYGEQKT